MKTLKDYFEKYNIMYLIFMLCIIILCILGTTGCTQQEQVNYNLSNDADNFNVRRRITVMNMRTDQCIFQMEGLFAIKTDNDTNELTVISKISDNEYQKHFIYLNEWTMYLVEQVESNDVNPYSYELTFMPQTLVPVIIVGEDG